jgi:hypothetical protein
MASTGTRSAFWKIEESAKALIQNACKPIEHLIAALAFANQLQ